MRRIIKLSKIEFYLDYSEDVPNVNFDNCEPTIVKNYGKGWRLPTLEELQYIRSLKIELNLFPDLNIRDDYWTSTKDIPDYIPEPEPHEQLDLRWYYQVRFIKPFGDPFLCNVEYYGNILPVRDI
jgi:hypothetical protein